MQAQARTAAAPAFAVAMFLSAALLFTLQPMFSRLTTPLLGGSPAVWNTSMVFFQAALLAGYFYAHLLQRIADVRIQAAIHAAILLTAFLVLPVEVTDALGAPNTEQPIVWLFGVLLLSIGAPFAAASATAPLLQAWYTRTGRADAHDPYYLYAASNLGSLLGLLLYPILIEPLLGAEAQSRAWTIGYLVAVALIVVCGAVVVAAKGPETGPKTGDAPARATAPQAHAAWRQRLYWLAAAALPSSLMLGVTQHISTDVASAPFLWVVPLALYLLTFIIAFLRGADRVTPFALVVHPLTLIALALSFLVAANNWFAALGAHLACFFISALICHLALARTRPAADRLTEFYLWISIGGVVGGAATALLAPVIFNGIYEYPLALAAIALFRPRGETQLPRLAAIFAGAAFTMAAVGAVLLFRPAAATVIFAGGLGAAAALLAAALPQDDPRPVTLRIVFMVCALIFAGLMTFVTLRPDALVAQELIEGVQRLVLTRPLKYAVLFLSFLTFAFVFHAALLPEPQRQPRVRVALGVAMPLIFLVLCFAAVERNLNAAMIDIIAMTFFALALFTNQNRPILLASLVIALFATVFFEDSRGAHLLRQDRSFFGVLRVEEYRENDPRSPPLRVLMHGTTIHGAQLTSPELSRRPLTYYNAGTALGESTLAGLAGGEISTLALVGLGTGTTACLMRQADRLTIFEIDPLVVRLSGPQGETFSYVRECQPNARVVVGDARLKLAEEPDGEFDVIVVDAFSSDAIPAHLLTAEAVAMYVRKLTPRGIVVLHLSNRNLALVTEATRVVRSLGLAHMWRLSNRVTDPIAGPYGGLPASAMIVARDTGVLANLPLQSPEWVILDQPEGAPWTDDYINLPRALYESWRGRD